MRGQFGKQSQTDGFRANKFQTAQPESEIDILHPRYVEPELTAKLLRELRLQCVGQRIYLKLYIGTFFQEENCLLCGLLRFIFKIRFSAPLSQFFLGSKLDCILTARICFALFLRSLTQDRSIESNLETFLNHTSLEARCFYTSYSSQINQCGL